MTVAECIAHLQQGHQQIREQLDKYQSQVTKDGRKENRWYEGHMIGVMDGLSLAIDTLEHFAQ